MGLGLTEQVPHYSTFSQNYIRRYKDTPIFDIIFQTVLEIIISEGLVDTSVIFVDGTHVKASANKYKRVKKQIKIVSDKYQKELENEIDDFRESIGRDKFFDDNYDDYTIDEETGEVTNTNEEYKEVTKSTVDPDAGMFVKGEHERQFAYVDQVTCDKLGWIFGYRVNPGNMHDSKAFLPFFEEVLLPFQPNYICGDAAYLTAQMAKTLQDNNIDLVAPYMSPKGKRSGLTKKHFTYHLELNAYICPNGKWLTPMNVSRNGHIEYQIPRNECLGCPFQNDCIKTYNTKTITRHLHEDCIDLAKQLRLSKEGKEIYKLRKQSCERVFADGKERHGLCFTRFKGLQKNVHMRGLLYACMNIKIYALLIKERANNMTLSFSI